MSRYTAAGPHVARLNAFAGRALHVSFNTLTRDCKPNSRPWQLWMVNPATGLVIAYLTSFASAEALERHLIARQKAEWADWADS